MRHKSLFATAAALLVALALCGNATAADERFEQLRTALGHIASKDPERVRTGFATLKQFAGEGHLPSMRLYGEALAVGGAGMPATPADGVAWTRKAAEAGDPSACYNLSTYHEQGRFGVPQDLKAAIDWRVKAADAGHPAAALTVAQFYIFAAQGFPKDLPKANGYLEIAKEGEPFALVILGVHAYKGMGMAQDVKKAIAYWQLADRRGAKEAQTWLNQVALEQAYPGAAQPTPGK